MIRIGSIVFVPVLVLVVVLLLWHRMPWPAFRRPRRRHIVTRIVCGALGAGIIVALGVGSWLDVRRLYATGVPEQVLASTRSLEAMFPDLKPGQHVELEQARLLVHFLVADASTPVLRTLHSDQREIRWKWSGPSGGAIAGKQRFARTDVEYSFDPGRLFVARDEGGRHILKMTGGKVAHSYRGPLSSGNGKGYDASFEGEPLRSGLWRSFTIMRIRPLSGVHEGLSLVPVPTMPRITNDTLCLLFISLAAEDDPLRKVELNQYVADLSDVIWEETPQNEHSHRYLPTRSHRVRRAGPAPGAELGDRLGVPAILLAVAAVLLTQLFTRRKAALVALSMAIVLYAAAVDRLAIEAHAARMADPEESTGTRMIASVGTAATFFWRDTARRRIAAVAADANNPAPLRKFAGALADSYVPRTKVSASRQITSILLADAAGAQSAGLEWVELYRDRTGRPIHLIVWPNNAPSFHGLRASASINGKEFLFPRQGERIAIVSRDLTLKTIGTREDFLRAADEWDGPRSSIAGPEIWQGLVLPALKAEGW